MKILHEPNLRTVMMVERAILDAKTYPTRKELWKSLPKGVQYQTFARVLEYLEASGQDNFQQLQNHVDIVRCWAMNDSCVEQVARRPQRPPSLQCNLP